MVVESFNDKVGKARGRKGRSIGRGGVGKEVGNLEEDLEFKGTGSGMIR